MKKINKIVLHVPHSSMEIPSNAGFFQWEGDYSEFKKAMLEHTDVFTDKLFSPVGGIENVEMVKYRYSRFFCDVERLDDDPMEEIGQGIYYTKYGDFERIISEEERQFALESREKHLINVKNAIVDENTLLIDCHSFSDDGKDIDICIGYNEDWSMPQKEVLNIVMEHFKGYKIGINTPFSNSLSPKKEHNYQSFMIEINKRWYTNDNGELQSDYYKRASCISMLYQKLLKI